MIDSVLKGTGNSRFLKSAVPAGTSWADALAMLQAGTFPIDFNGINTEGFQQVGTPLNKANLLKDATAAQIGLPPSTTPDGMFRALGNTGELHVWRKTARDASVSAPGYNLGDRTSADICQNTAGNTGDFGVNIEYASEITVDNNGVISLTSPVAIVLKFNGKTATFSPTNAANALKNKFLKIVSVSDDNPSATILKSYKGTVFHCESDFDCYGYGNSSPGYIISLSSVKPVTSYPAGFAHTYPVSTNPKAYQEGDDAKAAGYVVGEVVTGNRALTNPSYPTQYKTWQYGDSVVVSDDGIVSIQSPATVQVQGNSSNYLASAKLLIGKFVSCINSETDFDRGIVYFIPADASITMPGSVIYTDRYQPVTGYAAIPAGTTIEYLGKLGDKARVQVVSYVGTGTSSSAYPNKLIFDFQPKIVFLSSNNGEWYAVINPLAGTFKTNFNRSYSAHKCSVDGNEFTFYPTDSGANYFNLASTKYTAIAIG